MRITFISDTHGQHASLQLAPCDLLIHAGDVSKRGTETEVQDFLDWFDALDIPHKVFVAGNHDFLMERKATLFTSMLPDSVTYLRNDATVVEGIKIWGSPVTPYFFNWAFNRQRGADLQRYWDKIPADTDILVTHGPPRGFGDKTVRGEEVGCDDLLDAALRVQPRYHVFGHIHEDYGVQKYGTTTFINASVLDLSYELKHPPISIDW